MRALLLAALALVAGCFIGAGSFAGKGCDSNNDCPEPYVCAQVRGSGRSCELVHGIEIGGGTGGGQATGTPDYCHQLKDIFDRSCISNCHGPDSSGSSLPFRFDLYTSGAGGLLEKALRIKQRMIVDDMPPSGSPTPRLTVAERTMAVRWVDIGAPFCIDGGTDAGKADGGTDAGKADGGDGG